MKLKSLLMLTIGASLFMTSCKKGDTGPAGPAGATGTPGAPGAKGDKGDNANVIYSDWTAVHFAANTHPASESTTDANFDYIQTINAPKLTSDILNKGQVLVYIKNSEGTITSLGGVNFIYDKILNNDGSINNYVYLALPTFETGKLKLLLEETDGDMDIMVPMINSSNETFRYILIPGLSSATGRLGGYKIDELRKMPYADAMNVLGIKP